MGNRIKLLGLLLVAGFGGFVSFVWAICCIVVDSDRAWRILVAYDRLANAATGGKDTETISSRAYRGTKEKARAWCVLCWVLDHIQKDHCKDSEGV